MPGHRDSVAVELWFARVRTVVVTEGLAGLQSMTDSVVAFLAQPFVAGLIGVLFGIALIMLTRKGVRFMTPEQPELGVVRAVALSMLGLVAAFVALLLFYLFVRGGLVAFGLGLIAGFIVPAFIALFASSGVIRTSS